MIHGSNGEPLPRVRWILTWLVILALLALALAIDLSMPNVDLITPLYAIAVLTAAWRLAPRSVVVAAVLALLTALASTVIQSVLGERQLLHIVGLLIIGALAVLVSMQKRQLTRHAAALLVAEKERGLLITRLEEERNWLRTVIDRSPAGILLLQGVPAAGVVANVGVEEIFGKPLALAAPGVDGYRDQVYTPNGATFAPEDFVGNRALRGETVVGAEAIVRQPSGRTVPVLISASPIRGATGAVVGAVIAFTDITLIRSAERLREEWTSVVAHDLRQPVTIITGYASLAAHQIEHQGSTADAGAIQHILTSAHALNRMIRDLLDASQIVSDRLEIRSQSIDLGALTRAVVERMAEIAQDHQILLNDLDEIPPLEVDPGRIEQVLGNLLNNAAKYSYPNAPIVLTVTWREGEARVSVTNQGDGIRPEEMPVLFDRFYRATVARTGQIGGLGLGLYIAKGCVEAHGGRIWVESVPRETTTFFFTLPGP